MLQQQKVLVVHANSLIALGIKSILTDYFNPAHVELSHDAALLQSDQTESFHLFITSPEFFTLYHDFFFPRRSRTLILLPPGYPSETGPVHTLDTRLAPGDLVDRICQWLLNLDPAPLKESTQEELSAREVEVLLCIVQGFMNKQIAEKLSISLHTVISHRKNIMHKLGIKTVSGLTVYAIMNGYISAEYNEL